MQSHYYNPAGSGYPTAAPRGCQSYSQQPDVPTAVRNLITAMKNIQESLQLWSTRRATEAQVSDCYMQFGAEFNATARAFEIYGINTSDINSVPARLRTELEICLGEDPSPQNLNLYMPGVRQLLYEILQGLRSKQSAWRAASGRPPMVIPHHLD
ncbi:hypothetical protein BJ138DRAFT_1115925 [Hygrophoropsis aurantiaca]|uniref:Uncharacterized protein n=1 Tax=Hygrophoropsis aurantiaca TaxID=72124 RepID=A0ACB8A5N7_9AGAM|nr:hypothetical protein BJ138DRAFT_1115925 [Hygrophoropsis aurantiaca]